MSLFPTSADDLLIAAYQKQGRTLDDLPYTAEFERLHEAVEGPGDQASRRELFHRLHNLRKAGKLPRLGRAATAPPAIDPTLQPALTALVEQAVDKLSLRDRLPYTPQFDDIVQQFNAQAGLTLPPHDVWRIIAKLAK